MECVPKDRLIQLLKDVGEVFKLCARKTKILPTLAWGPEVATEFFRNQESTYPAPVYSVDRTALDQARANLEQIRPRVQGEHPVLHWLQRTLESFLRGIDLLYQIERPAFFEVSSEIYGESNSRLFNGQTTNLELARAISSRMAIPSLNDINESLVQMSAEEFSHAKEIRRWLYTLK
jgi:hypothetical protein